MPSQTFPSLEDALQHAVTLAAERRTYIINVVGPADQARGHAATVQVVPEEFVYHNGRLGLTVHLPFDPASGQFAHLVEFTGTNLEEYCDEYQHDGIPCFALCVGSDVLLAERVLRFVLMHVYNYPTLGGFEFEVHDEGPLDS